MFIIKTKITKRTKSSKCPHCHKPMKVFYTKESYKMNGKYKRYFKKVGYICNHIFNPMIILTEFSENYIDNQDNYMIGVYDIDTRDLLESFKSFNLKGIIY